MFSISERAMSAEAIPMLMDMRDKTKMEERSKKGEHEGVQMN